MSEGKEPGDGPSRPLLLDWTVGGLMFVGVAITIQAVFHLEAGSAAEWVSALATVAALAAAVYAGQAAWRQLRIQQRALFEQAHDKETGQARLVAGWVSTIHVARNLSTNQIIGMFGLDVALRNASELPVYELSGWVQDRETGGSVARAPFSIQVLEPAATPAKETILMRTGLLDLTALGDPEEHKLPSAFEVEFDFRDSAGKWWHRSGAGGLSAVEPA
ncbi:MAG TPA: hypothetical protein VGE38_03665 [Nocardioides sp.]|uniref:hypothetical protein n=1 Tax=Nocardioides sp. TaxID=35761 RepID=UPI002ED8B29E